MFDSFLKNKYVLIILLLGFIFISGCSSIGHEKRSVPHTKIPLNEMPREFVIYSDMGELSQSVTSLLKLRGIETHVFSVHKKIKSKINSRYSIKIGSTEIGPCIPEGSTQMHFSIVAIDNVENKKLLVIRGTYGCKDTIVNEFEDWLFN